MRSRSHLQRLVAVLLLVAMWTFALVGQDRCALEEERELSAHGQCPVGKRHPATQTPKFGLDDEPRTPVDGSPLLDPCSPRAMRTVAELVEPAASGSVTTRRHSTPRSTRGPPTQG